MHHAHQVRPEAAARHEVRRQRVRPGHEEVRAAGAEAGGAVVRVLPLVRRDHRRRVLVRPLHALLHAALGRRAPVVAPACVSPEEFFTRDQKAKVYYKYNAYYWVYYKYNAYYWVSFFFDKALLGTLWLLFASVSVYAIACNYNGHS